ncbi:hypothetical protein [Sphingomonas hengshuiensis]|uniref:DUF1570 domain-containing protein n=1 Tax=Sphingomonas hengshuiensis TaxID=1609977 RepID=A0A7U4JBV5_9SPHN|nr:hypothetical protein [Sphingomonas hengshuiensis]AJP73973.1 hypothetical protein TS85_22465 [Sphingomonas hengshuiensis]
MIRRLCALALLALPTPAAAEWHEASSAHFRVYSEQPVDRLTRFATELERFDKAIRLLRGDPDKPVGKANRVTVFVVDDTEAVQALLGRGGVAGFYRARAGGSLAFVPRHAGAANADDLDAQAILLHEYAHHLMFSMAPNAVYPAWYIEGFAEAMAATSFGKDGSVLIGNMPQYRAHSIMGANPLPVRSLLLDDPSEFDAMQNQALYGQGWLLTHYITFGKARQDQFGAYLLALNRGKSPAEAAAAFGDLGKLGSELERYKVSRLQGLRINPQAIGNPAVAVRALTPGEAATMDVRIQSKNGVSARTAPDVYAAARKAAAPFPKDPGAQIALAEAAFDADDFAAAEAAADRAIAADPKSIDGHVYKAKAQMATAQRAKDERPETWNAIRRSILVANNLDPQDPEPLILYFASFAAAHQPPGKDARDGLYSAFLLAPQDSGLRYATATMLLRTGDAARARTLLAPLAWQPHAAGRAKQARALLARIDAGDVEGAVRLLDSPPKAPAKS